MSELFGGFDRSFYDAYEGVRPVTPEYASRRKAMYQLYYLLVHVNLFGAGYVAGATAAARAALRELG
jgi:fructosamine-3-kinase